jgi:hypothetical protein
MLRPQDKKDMLADAHDPQRKRAFAESRRNSLRPLSWTEYFIFLKSVQNFFSVPAKPHKITGKHFKL